MKIETKSVLSEILEQFFILLLGLATAFFLIRTIPANAQDDPIIIEGMGLPVYDGPIFGEDEFRDPIRDKPPTNTTPLLIDSADARSENHMLIQAPVCSKDGILGMCIFTYVGRTETRPGEFGDLFTGSEPDLVKLLRDEYQLDQYALRPPYDELSTYVLIIGTEEIAIGVVYIDGVNNYSANCIMRFKPLGGKRWIRTGVSSCNDSVLIPSKGLFEPNAAVFREPFETGADNQ